MNISEKSEDIRSDIRALLISILQKHFKQTSDSVYDSIIKDLDSNCTVGSIGYEMDELLGLRRNHYFNYWTRENHELTDLWRNVVIKNASISETPELTANNVLKEFNSKFLTQE